MAYAKVEQLADHLQMADASGDALLEVALDAAHNQVNEWCRRTFVEVDPDTDPTQTFTYRIDGDQVWVGDIVDVDTVEFKDGDTWVAVTEFELEPFNAEMEDRPYRELTFDRTWRGRIRVTGWFGWPRTPAAVVQAEILQAARLHQRRNAQFGVATVPGLDGSGMRLLAKLDADVELLLAPYRRQPVLI